MGIRGAQPARAPFFPINALINPNFSQFYDRVRQLFGFAQSNAAQMPSHLLVNSFGTDVSN